MQEESLITISYQGVKKKELKIYTKDSLAEGVVIYPILKEDQDKIVMIRQYRYPLDDYLYELPAGLIDEGETPEEAAIREMMEETGLTFTVYEDGEAAYRRPSSWEQASRMKAAMPYLVMLQVRSTRLIWKIPKQYKSSLLTKRKPHAS